MINYKKEIIERLNLIEKSEEKNINHAVELVVNAIKNNGLIYIFGSGHSSLLAQDQFYRAGGLGNICPIFHEPLMLHKSASSSSVLEKQVDYYQEIVNKYHHFKPNDLIIIISTSGKNNVPVQLVKHLKQNYQTPILTISSFAYLKSATETISQFGDVNINNHCDYGDAIFQLRNLAFTPASTMLNTFIMNTIISQAIEDCLEKKINLDVYKSGNIENSQEHNQKIINKYQSIIKEL